MKNIMKVLNWLKVQLAKSVMATIIIVLLACLLAAVTDRWLHTEFAMLEQVLREEQVTSIEYWGVLVLIYIILLLSIKMTESVISVVLLKK